VTARCAGTPGLPCAMVLRLIARSPWRRIPLASIAGELTIPRKPGCARKISASLTPATGARTTRLCRPRLPPPKPLDRLMCCRPRFQRRRLSAGRLRAGWSLTGRSPPCDPVRARHCRVHRIPRPTSVTIAIRPSHGCGMRGGVGVIWGNREAEYFCPRHWTKPCLICPASDATGSSFQQRDPRHGITLHDFSFSRASPSRRGRQAQEPPP